MENFPTKDSAIKRPSASKEADDSAKQNQIPTILDHLDDNSEQVTDVEKMFQELDSISIESSKSEKEIFQNLDLIENENLSKADKIKNFIEEIREGKSSPEILKILIKKFQHEPEVSTWVENWRNFLKLHQLASSKPEHERKVIQQIVFSTDFSDETAFKGVLKEITSNESLSDQTKLEISQEFNRNDIVSVDALDTVLQHIKTQKKSAQNLLLKQQGQQKDLDDHIEKLKAELDSLPTQSPKRDALENEITQKQKQLNQIESDIMQLQAESNQDISYSLRSGFTAKLNHNNSRSINAVSDNFQIQLPNTTLPFTNLKNLRSINLSFLAEPLRNSLISDLIFSPNLENKQVPTKSQKKMGHFILSSLSFDDSLILSQKEIDQLNKDIKKLTFSPMGKSGTERLIDLGVYDFKQSEINKNQLQKVLAFISENRNLESIPFNEKLANHLNNSSN